MKKTKYKIDIPGNGKEIIPFSAEFQRINIILGGNGTGKSKILNKLKGHVNSFGFARQLIYVEGGRTMTIPDSLQLDQRNFNQYRTYQQTENSYKSKRQTTISQRIKDALILLEQKEQEINNTFAKEAHNWDLFGRKDSFPFKPQAPLERLFDIFNEVFPSISLKFISAQKSLKCYKNGSEYSPSQLSDGEKQIFCLLADIFMLTEPGSLIIVDEPELNLNPGLACRFWDILENELPESIFIYATHCVSFAMRRHVDYVVVLSKTLGSVTTIEDLSEIPPNDLRELLGAIPSILSSSSAIAIEGTENSFDQAFYRWLLSDNDIEVIPIGGCNDVHSVANKTGIWDKIAPSVKIVGVIDSDFRNEGELNNFKIGSTHVLKYHEIESYLCNPKLINEVADKLSVLDSIPSESELTEFIIELFESKINHISAQRTFARGKIRLGVSVEKNALSRVESEEDLKTIISIEAKKEEQKASNFIGESKILEILEEELYECKQALENKDLSKILKLMPGKELLNKLAPKAGCRSERNLVNAVKRHIDLNKYPELSSLRDELKAKYE